MRILVTGGAGFIGSHFVRLLLGPDPGSRPTAVTVLDALTYAGDLTRLDAVAGDPRYDFVYGDVRDRPLVEELVGGHDAVVHLAAETHVDRSIGGAGEFVSSNVLGTQVLLDAVLRHGRTLVHVSTDEVYGSIAEGSWTEDCPPAPRSPYAAAKASSDLLALAYHHTHGLDVRVTRCSNNYGPYQHPEKLIPRFSTLLLDGGRVPLYGDGRNVRDWLHVEDHCRALLRVLLAGRAGRVYNIGGGTELTNLRLTRLLLDAFGAGPERIERVPDRKGHDLRYSVDSGRIRRELGWRPRHSFAEGLAATVDWYRDNRAWWERHLAERDPAAAPQPSSRTGSPSR
ncbi:MULTISPECIES: dTDP-glucose 4,6-dehydratase [unclassified Streptomyces]|uniref:dTDP-glucose 4,6-dehydratase n=1 Tax=unclassified Streptomyces TaxID=2593676 RepID=UPI000939C172|nr:dTDP-glucose 4,6-dehydratase [Streptomyces sp. TSRI0107]OKJ79633.1 dTDP-glucose 4,6-dehydratase [Streptomyces sp. TSRI0107]